VSEEGGGAEKSVDIAVVQEVGGEERGVPGAFGVS
jgi:hypothetical protein